MTWNYRGNTFNADLAKGYIGFVYRITDLDTGEMYIGKKSLKFHRRLKKTDKRRTTIDSDWLDYYGSSETLNARIAIKGKDKFHREILVLCKTKGELNFAEVMALFHVQALEDERYINQSINKWRKKSVAGYGCLNELRQSITVEPIES